MDDKNHNIEMWEKRNQWEMICSNCEEKQTWQGSDTNFAFATLGKQSFRKEKKNTPNNSGPAGQLLYREHYCS